MFIICWLLLLLLDIPCCVLAALSASFHQAFSIAVYRLAANFYTPTSIIIIYHHRIDNESKYGRGERKGINVTMSDMLIEGQT